MLARNRGYVEVWCVPSDTRAQVYIEVRINCSHQSVYHFLKLSVQSERLPSAFYCCTPQTHRVFTHYPTE